MPVERIVCWSSTLAVVPDAVTYAQAVAEEVGLEEDVTDKLLLALSEAAANASAHGNRLDPTKIVTLRLVIDEAAVEAHVSDEGPGMARGDIEDAALPTDVLNPGGRGLFIIRELADRLDLLDDGRCLCMVFERSR